MARSFPLLTTSRGGRLGNPPGSAGGDGFRSGRWPVPQPCLAAPDPAQGPSGPLGQAFDSRSDVFRRRLCSRFGSSPRKPILQNVCLLFARSGLGVKTTERKAGPSSLLRACRPSKPCFTPQIQRELPSALISSGCSCVLSHESPHANFLLELSWMQQLVFLSSTTEAIIPGSCN